MENAVSIKFANKEQADAFAEWFENYGLREFMENDHVHDDLPEEYFPKRLSDRLGRFFIVE